MNCIHCETPNPERWFYCRSCGNKASEALYTTNLFMMSEAGKRSDIEFSTMSMDSHVEKFQKRRKREVIKFGKKE